MEDKTFDLIEKMYSELSEFKKDMNEFRKDMNDFRKETNSRLNKIEITLENDIKPKLQILGEQGSVNTTKLDEHSLQLNNLNNKIDYLALSVNSQDKRLDIVESSKRKKAK